MFDNNKLQPFTLNRECPKCGTKDDIKLEYKSKSELQVGRSGRYDLSNQPLHHVAITDEKIVCACRVCGFTWAMKPMDAN